MGPLQKLSSLPVKFAHNIKYPLEVLPVRRHLGSAHIASATVTNSVIQHRNELQVDPEQIVQLSSPEELKGVMGTDKYFAEQRGTEIIAFAGTKKLLSEEKLRKTLENFKVPMVVKANTKKVKPSGVHPICPAIQEEL